MTFGLILLVLIPIAAVGYIVWDFKRKTAQRAAARAGRLTELIGVATEVQPQPQTEKTPTPMQPQPQSANSVGRTAPTAAPVPRTAPQAAPAPRTDTAPDAPSLYARRERVLNPAQTLVHLLLKTGLPDHVVFARVTLASILEAGPGLSGFAREEQARRLAALTVDFVVADKNMRPLAVVELAAADESSVAQTDRASTRNRLAAAGVRYVELDARALPRKDGIRAAVLGDPQAVGAPAIPAGVTR